MRLLNIWTTQHAALYKHTPMLPHMTASHTRSSTPHARLTANSALMTVLSRATRGHWHTCTWPLAGASFIVTLVASLTAPLACTNRTLPVRQHCPTGCNVWQRQLVRHAACLSHWTWPPCSLKAQLDSDLDSGFARESSAHHVLETNNMQSAVRSCCHRQASGRPDFTCSSTTSGCPFTHQQIAMRGAHTLASEKRSDNTSLPLGAFPPGAPAHMLQRTVFGPDPSQLGHGQGQI